MFYTATSCFFFIFLRCSLLQKTMSNNFSPRRRKSIPEECLPAELSLFLVQMSPLAQVRHEGPPSSLQHLGYTGSISGFGPPFLRSNRLLNGSWQCCQRCCLRRCRSHSSAAFCSRRGCNSCSGVQLPRHWCILVPAEQRPHCCGAKVPQTVWYFGNCSSLGERMVRIVDEKL